MACLPEKMAVVGSFTVLAGSGAIAIAGAPTVVLSVAGASVAVGSLLLTIGSLGALKNCFEQHGRLADAAILAPKIARLEDQLARIRAQFGLT